MSEDSVKNDSSTEEIDLLELAKKLWAKRRFIGKYAIIAAVIGLIVGFSIPKEYAQIEALYYFQETSMLHSQRVHIRSENGSRRVKKYQW